MPAYMCPGPVQRGCPAITVLPHFASFCNPLGTLTNWSSICIPATDDEGPCSKSKAHLLASDRQTHSTLSFRLSLLHIFLFDLFFLFVCFIMVFQHQRFRMGKVCMLDFFTFDLRWYNKSALFLLDLSDFIETLNAQIGYACN